MIRIYGIKSCDSCRKAVSWFREHELEHEFHDLREDGITIQLLESWADRVDWEALLNRRSLTWRRIPDLDKQNLSRAGALALMLENPTLIKRPVLEADRRMVVGFDAEAYEKLFAR